MSDLKHTGTSNTSFWITAGTTIVFSSALIAAAWPAVTTQAQAKATELAQAGKRAEANEAQLNYQLAKILDPTNQLAATELAKLQLNAGQNKAALDSLKQAGEGSDIMLLRLRANLELNRSMPAVEIATALAARDDVDRNIVLIGLAYRLFGQTDLLSSLSTRLSSPEAVQHLQMIQSSDIAVGQLLFAQGLLESAQRHLTQASDSLARNLLLSKLLLRTPSPENIEVARRLYVNALTTDPTNIEARRELIKVLKSQNNGDEAHKQELLLDRLNADRP